MRPLAPIALFVYNRPRHTAETLRALAANVLSEQSELHIFADGAPENASPSLLQDIADVRGLIESRTWCRETHIHKAPRNKGLATSIIDGVTTIVNEHGRAIVLEDDIVTGPGFLTFMNQSLSLYEADDAVMSVTGYMYPVDDTGCADTFFLRSGISCWGWGTWARAWKYFQKDASVLMTQVRRASRKRFNWNQAFDYFGMLDSYIHGLNDSWGVRWYASVYVQGGFGLFPRKSLVRNIGFDGTGVHCGVTHRYETSLDSINAPAVIRVPIVHDGLMFDRIVKLYRPSIRQRLTTFSRSILPTCKSTVRSVRSRFA